MKKVIRLTERDLTRLVKRVIIEMNESDGCVTCIMDAARDAGINSITEEKANMVYDIIVKEKRMPTMMELKDILPNFKELMYLGTFVKSLLGCKDKCMSESTTF